MYYVGIDIGGTTVKGMIADEKGNVICENYVDTVKGGEGLTENVVNLVDILLKQSGLKKADIAGIGMGSPGLINSEEGKIVFAGNLQIHDYPLADKVKEKTGIPVKITNDANAAALGEAKFGAAKEYSDSIFITLGTGVGGGVIINGKLYEGYKSAGTELGHMVIQKDGEQCSCGRKGCFEAYGSATALIRKTKEVMKEHTDSLMWSKYNLETVCGKTPFDFCDSDKYAKEIVDWYVSYLACGLANFSNIFRPQVFLIGGGVSNAGDKLIKPLTEKFEKEIFGGNDYCPVVIKQASLGNKAGAFGAIALFLD